MAPSRRLVFGFPPFSFIVGHLTKENDFAESAKAVLAIDGDRFANLSSQLANFGGFLSRGDVTRLVNDALGQGSGHLAAFIYQIANIIHDSGMDAEKAMEQLAKEIEEKTTQIPVDDRRRFAERIKKLSADPGGLAKQFKAQGLVDATGAEMDGFKIICDIRPIFDPTRKRIDGAIPLAIFHIELTDERGDAQVVELRINEKQISQLLDKLADAREKLAVLKRFLTDSCVAVPVTTATTIEKE